VSGPSRPVLRYHGGKWMLAPWIIEHFPPHRVYTEAFGGGASVLMRKPRAKMVEVYNDLFGEVVSLFRVLRDPSGATRLAELLALTPYSREEFQESYEPSEDAIEQARRTIVRSLLGFGSNSASGMKSGFRSNGNRQNTHPARDWVNYPAAIATFCERLQCVVIENRAAVDVIQQHDRPDTLHYCDPPYVHDTRSIHTTRTSKGYAYEMTDADHRELARVLRACEGMVIVSGYPSELYAELFAGWHTSERRALADGAGYGRVERTEVLWMNDACADALKSGHGLFAGVEA
jgi:DNA adenine methylase